MGGFLDKLRIKLYPVRHMWNHREAWNAVPVMRNPGHVVTSLLLFLLAATGTFATPIPVSAERLALGLEPRILPSPTSSNHALFTTAAAGESPDPFAWPALPTLEDIRPINTLYSPLWRFDDLFKAPVEGSDAAEWSTKDAHALPATIPIVHDSKVERHIQYFNGTIRHRFEQWLTRVGRYRPMVEHVFAEFGLPLDLLYLSLVESGFNPRAYSRARATGPWQFMKGTGRLYGLRVNYYVDERRDPLKSTVAAARYLRDLYDMFGTWPLAMAAYNGGEGRVRRALQRTDGDSFYDIAQTRHIRRETKEYVPRFMAATIIAKNPDHYGFSSLLPTPHQFEEVLVTRPLHLRDIAKAAGVSYRKLRSLNPELRRYVTPPKDKQYHLKVPVGTKTRVASVLDKIPSWKRSVPPRMKGSKVPKGWYRVRLGDSLWKIAKRFRISVRELKARNNLSGWLIRPGDLLAIR